MHAAGLLAVLAAFLPYLGTGASYGSDEGAYIFQARSLEEDGSWVVQHPDARLDVDVGFPVTLSERTPDGWIAVAKRPAYPLLLAAADRVAGATGMVLVSVLGVGGAALAAGHLARRLNPSAGWVAVWATGLATPLCFDAYLVMGHTLAAAFAGFAMLGALASREQPRALALAGFALAIVAAVLIRSEALLLAVAIGSVLAVDALRRREARRLLVAALPVIAGSGAALAERVWYHSIVPSGSLQKGAAEGTTTLTGRADAFVQTWLSPSFEALAPAHVMLVALVVLGAATVVVARVQPAEQLLLVGASVAVVLGAAAIVTAAIADYRDLVVPGLLMASPFVAWGLLTFGRVSGERGILLAICGVFVLAVLATQYDVGGGLEWGGRFFAIALPIAVPALVVSWGDLARTVDPKVRVAGMTALLATTLAVDSMAVLSIERTHTFVSRLLDGIDAVGARTDPGDGGSPLVVTLEADIGRFSWPAADRQRWLWAETDDELDALLDGLETADVESFVLLTQDPEESVALLPEAYSTSQAGRVGSWRLIVVEVPTERTREDALVTTPPLGPASRRGRAG